MLSDQTRQTEARPIFSHANHWLTSLRARFLLLILLAMIPAAIFLVYDVFINRIQLQMVDEVIGFSATLVALVIIWIGSDRLILRRVERLVRVTQRLANGDLSIQAHAQAGTDDLDQLAQTFNQIADHLQQREAEYQQNVEALQASETRFARTFAFSPFPLAITRLADGKIVDLNAAFERLTGYTRAEALGYTPDELRLWVDPQVRADGLKDLRTGALIVNFEADFRMKDGSTVTCMLGGGLVTLDDQQCVVTSLMDVTERKRAEARARVLAQVGELVRQLADPDAFLYAVAQVVGDHLLVQRSFFLELDLENDRGSVQRDYCRGVPSIAGSYRLSQYSSETGQEMDLGHTIVNRDSQRDPRTAAYYDQTYGPNGERAYIAVPLMRDGRRVAAFWVNTDTPRDWSKDEVTLLETVAERAWLAVEKMRLDQQVHRERESLQKIFDAIPVMITRYRHDTGILQLNPEFERTTGWTTAEAQHMDWMAACYPDPAYREEVQQFMQSLAEGWKDVLMTTRSGRVIETMWANILLSDEAQVGIGLDITERKRAEAALRLARAEAEQSAERIARLQAITSELTAALTPIQVSDVILRQGAAILGAMIVSIKRVSDDGQWLENLGDSGFSPEIRNTNERYPVSGATHMAEAVRTGEPVWLESQAAYSERYPLAAKEIVALGVEAACAIPLRLGDQILGALGIGFSTPNAFNPPEREFLLTLSRQCAQALERARLYEVEQRARVELEERVRARTAELEQSSAQLSSLSARLQATREEERQRLSRELHDQLGGALTGLKIDVSQIHRHMPEGDTQTKLKGLMTTIDGIVQTVRQLAMELRPGTLDDFGLAAAIEWQLQEFEKRSGIRSRYSAEEGPSELDKEIATAIFRVFQEALTNVVRHAQASEVSVRLQQQIGYLLLQVHDNGRGINPSDLANVKSLGLLGMRERVRLFSGELDIQGAPGLGTTVQVRIPLQP